jgi:uncharacterized protein (TIGR02996 family)
MSDRQALLRTIRENPADDAPRLVFADWCDENGEPERAAFIRAQCRYAAANPGVGAAPIADPEVRRLWEIGTEPGGFLEVPGFYGMPYWKRGFIESVRLRAADWLAHGSALAKRPEPIRPAARALRPRRDGERPHPA